MGAAATVALSILLIVATVAAAPVVGVAQTGTTADDSTEQTGTPTAPGEQFAGVVGVQAAEVEGEIETRRLETRLESADSDEERARVVAETTNETVGRVEALRERREMIETAHENGTLSDGQYRARLARLATEIRTAERVANRSAEVTESLPAAALESNGVNRSAVGKLRRNASELHGQEVAEAARDIAGPEGGDDRPGPPDGVGPGANTTDDEGDADGADAGNPGSSGEAPGRSNGSSDGNGSVDGTAENDSESAGNSGSVGAPGGAGGPDNDDPEDAPANDDDAPDDPKAPTENRKSGDENGNGAGQDESRSGSDGAGDGGNDSEDPDDGNGDDEPQNSGRSDGE
jgi:hypothetical protein